MVGGRVYQVFWQFGRWSTSKEPGYYKTVRVEGVRYSETEKQQNYEDIQCFELTGSLDFGSLVLQ